MLTQISIELTIFIASALLLLSIFASKISDRFGVPALLIFLGLGMFAGSEGIGGIYFNDPWLAKFIGIIALIFILFSGGLETKWTDVRPVLWQGISLATLGVLVTAALVAWFSMAILKFDFLQGMLLGAIISSTDAASVLSILRSKGINLRTRLQSLLELESGSNDPMAVFLTIGTIHLMTKPGFTFTNLFPQFLWEVAVGLAMAFMLSRLFLLVVNNFHFAYEGLYPVLTLAFAPLIYAITAMANGNGFLAVYAAGLLIGNKDFLHKKSLIQFQGGISWLMQIFMFLILGLLVFPSHMKPIMTEGLLISLFLIFVARPVSIFIALAFSRMEISEKLMLSWVGLRGAVPIILATFPLLEHLPSSGVIFNIIFFIVLTSVFLQGTSIPYISRLLKVEVPPHQKQAFPIEFEKIEGIDADLEEVIIPYAAPAVGKRLFEIGIPAECLVVLLCREGKFHIPNGATVLEGGDVLQVLGKTTAIKQFEQTLHNK